MHFAGHYGLSLLGYAPIAYWFLKNGDYALAILGAQVFSMTVSVPDLDQRVPGIKHRGYSHTVWFAVLVGSVAGAIGYGIWTTVNVPFLSISPVEIALTSGLVATSTVLLHLLGDIITPMGLRPLAPISQKKYSLNIVKASNPFANYGLLFLGCVAGGAAVALGLSLI